MKDSYQNQNKIVYQVWKIIDVICYFMVAYLGYLAVITLSLFSFTWLIVFQILLLSFVKCYLFFSQVIF